MKIGLLLCDHVADDLQSAFGDYPNMFRGLLVDHQVKVYDCTKHEFPTNITECDGYMSSGSRHSVNDDKPWINTLQDIIQTLHQDKIPFVGCCFGHQILAKALGGSVEKSPHGWCVGMHTFTIQHEEKWMQPPTANLNLLMSCQDQVIQLPAKSTILASSAHCAVGMFKVADHMLGIQAHPEFSKGYCRTLIERRIDRIGEYIASEGLTSLETHFDPNILQQWIAKFYAQYDQQ